jgi:aldehyde dehydrogenase (NAD+)
MTHPVLDRLGISQRPSGVFSGEWFAEPGGGGLVTLNPATNQPIATVRTASTADLDRVVSQAEAAFFRWRNVPAPVRGELVRRLGEELRQQKDALAALVTLEVGKVPSEAAGEVQEMIDICDFAVGLSRQLHGLTIASERPLHRMMEQWHPLGVCGVITAFNFPVAVWAWNAALAAVCGDPVIWKPSPEAPLCAIAVQSIAAKVMAEAGQPGVFHLVIGDVESVGEPLIRDRRVPLISATGSTAMGRHVGQVVASRFGRTILELGGNNAIIVAPSADLDLALRAVVFAAAGTAGQRCTTLRRLYLHESIAEPFLARVAKALGSVKVGDPAEPGTLVGPLISHLAVERMQSAIARAKEGGGQVLVGGRRLDRPGNFVEPTLIRCRSDLAVMREETFAPILYATTYRDLGEALCMNNGVPQGLSSAIFTNDLREAELFVSADGSDCGIANVNIGTSGAEIGGAFGGEKETGGGRESGSDSWKGYMRRQTCTVNYGRTLPLAQGVTFEIEG